MTPDQRKAVVAEARTWERTPYHDHGNVKGAGADCALFPLHVYRRVLALPEIQIPKYQQQWHLHHSEELYLNYVRALGAIEISAPDSGDFVLWRIGRVYSHGAIVIAWPRIIHAVNPRGVIQGDASIDEKMSRTAVSKPLFFTF
jgi:cell wall-associated NlpC family hydrolase